jgi:hypothetical protein
MAANINFGAIGKAEDLKKRILYFLVLNVKVILVMNIN